MKRVGEKIGACTDPLFVLCHKRRQQQKRQQGNSRTRYRAIWMRSVAMELGLCRWARTRRSPRPEVGWNPGSAYPKTADVGRGGKTVPFRNEEPIRRDA